MAQFPMSLHSVAQYTSCTHARHRGLLQPIQNQLRRSKATPHIVWRPLFAAAKDDVQPVPDLVIPVSDLECDRRWISGMVAMWLDEEWTPLDVHKQLGQAAGDAYVKCRQQGDDDMSSLVLGLSHQLLTFNYRETFTDAFEVANKVVEMLMMRSGVDVCCTTNEDAARMQRYNSQRAAEKHRQ